MTTTIGIIGATIVLVCFIAIEFNEIDQHSPAYDLGNVLGSLVLGYYSYLLHSWPFIILNTVWGLVALRDLLKTLAARRKTR